MKGNKVYNDSPLEDVRIQHSDLKQDCLSKDYQPIPATEKQSPLLNLLTENVKINQNDNHFDNSQLMKNNVTKIFTTTVMEKKKNINFKVIKNREKEDFQIASQGIRNNFEKNNKIINKNDFMQEESSNEAEGSNKFFQNAIIDKRSYFKNFMEGYPDMEKLNYTSFSRGNIAESYTNPSNYYYGNFCPPNSGFENLLNGNNLNVNVKFQNGSSFQINRNAHFRHYVQPHSPKKKIKRENFNYLEILLNAAEKFLDQGFLFQNSSSESSSVQEENFENKNSSMDISTDKNEKVMGENLEKNDCPDITASHEQSEKLNENYLQNGNNPQSANLSHSNSVSSLSHSSRTKNINNCKYIPLQQYGYPYLI